MADVSIALSNIQNIKTVNIEGLGTFRVRKLGAGEELDLSLKMRRLVNILTDIQGIDLKSFDLTTEDGRSRVTKEEKRINKLSDEITEIKQFELNTYKRCFTSDKEGVVDSLIDGLSDEERGELFRQIFGEVKQVKIPESTQTTEPTETLEGALVEENDRRASNEDKNE